MSLKIVHKCWEISSKTDLLEFGLAKIDLWFMIYDLWFMIYEFKEDFLNIFHFTPPFFQALFKK